MGAPASSAYMNLDVNGLQNALTMGARLAGQALPYPPAEVPSVLGTMPLPQEADDAYAPESAAVPSPAAALEPEITIAVDVLDIASAPAPSTHPSAPAPKLAPAPQPAARGTPGPKPAAQAPSSIVSDVALPIASAPSPLGLPPPTAAPVKGNKYSSATAGPLRKAGLEATAPAPSELVPGTRGDPMEESLSTEAPAPAPSALEPLQQPLWSDPGSALEEPHDKAQGSTADAALASSDQAKPSSELASSAGPMDSKFDLPPTIASVTKGKVPAPVPVPSAPTPASPAPAGARSVKRTADTHGLPHPSATAGKASHSAAHAPASLQPKAAAKGPLKAPAHAPAAGSSTAPEEAVAALDPTPALAPLDATPAVAPLDATPAVAPSAPKKDMDELLLEVQTDSMQFSFTPEEIAASGWVPSPSSISSSAPAPAPSAKLPRRAGKGAEAGKAAEAPAPKMSRAALSPIVAPPKLEAPLPVVQG